MPVVEKKAFHSFYRKYPITSINLLLYSNCFPIGYFSFISSFYFLLYYKALLKSSNIVCNYYLMNYIKRLPFLSFVSKNFCLILSFFVDRVSIK